MGSALLLEISSGGSFDGLHLRQLQTLWAGDGGLNKAVGMERGGAGFEITESRMTVFGR